MRLDIVYSLSGAVLVGVILWEVFNDLFHPGGVGALSNWIGPRLFRTFKRRPRLLPMAGPLALVIVIGSWVAGLIVGFGLMYLPWYPAGFRTSAGTIPADVSSLENALYFSFATLITLGYGDLVPHSPFLRLAATFEALVGFGLLTASVSSIVLVYPSLARMRLLARSTSHLVEAETATGVAVADSGSDGALNALARDLTSARIDLIHFPVVYYFATRDSRASLAMWMTPLARLASEAQSSNRPNHVRLAGAALDHALTDFALLLDERFLHTGATSRERIFEAFARDHVVDR